MGSDNFYKCFRFPILVKGNELNSLNDLLIEGRENKSVHRIGRKLLKNEGDR